MKLSRKEKRLLMLYEYKAGLNAADAARRINKACGNKTVGESTVRERFREFKTGNEDLEDKERSGRPQEVDRQAVLEAIEDSPSLTTRMLADEFDCHYSTIDRILNEAGKSWKKSKWVPHKLNNAQKLNRVNASIRLLELVEEDPELFDDIITADEKWIGFDNPYKHNEWLSKGQKSSSTPVKDFRKEKRMLVVFWDRRGVVHHEFLKKGQNMTAALYCEILERVRRCLHPARRVILQHDNARPHTAKLTKKWLGEAGWAVLEHPPYSPDLAPSDFHLFRSMQHWLRDEKFDTEIDLRNSIIHFFNSKKPGFYARGIYLLSDKWQDVIDIDGEYLD